MTNKRQFLLSVDHMMLGLNLSARIKQIELELEQLRAQERALAEAMIREYAPEGSWALQSWVDGIVEVDNG